MRIGIVGTGSVGAALARGLAGKGHAVTLGARDPRAETKLTLAAETGSAVASPAEAAAGARLPALLLLCLGPMIIRYTHMFNERVRRCAESASSGRDGAGMSLAGTGMWQ